MTHVKTLLLNLIKGEEVKIYTNPKPIFRLRKTIFRQRESFGRRWDVALGVGVKRGV